MPKPAFRFDGLLPAASGEGAKKNKLASQNPATGLPTANIGRITHFVTAIAVNTDYDVSRHFGVRAVLGNVPVRYRKSNQLAPGIGAPPFLNWLSQEYFVTNENWDVQTGVVFRF